MTTPTFENVEESFFAENVVEQEEDSLYVPAELKSIARKLTFVLFDEIIQDSPGQSRKDDFDPSKNKKDLELLNSIKANGIVVPIVVRSLGNENTKHGEREFGLVFGHRRVAAGRMAGLAGTDGYVSNEREDHRLLTIAENTGRRELSSYEKGVSLKSLQEARGFTVREIAEVTGISRSYINELIQPLQSPEALIQIWADGDLTPRAIIELKSHWPALEKEGAANLDKYIRGLSQQQASDVAVQLEAGKTLKQAVTAVKGVSSTGGGNGNNTSKKAGPEKTGNTETEDDLIRNMVEVFPGIKEKQASSICNYGVVEGAKEPEILWVAALYVNQGGNLNKAVALSKTAMAKRSHRNMITRRIKLAKQTASHLKRSKKEDKTMREFLKVVLS